MEKTREASEQQRFVLALISIWLVALPFLSCLEVFFLLWLLLPRECSDHKIVTVVAVLLTIT